MVLRLFGPRSENPGRSLLQKHFADLPLDRLVTAGRTFPVTTRVDLQLALERQFREKYPAAPVGLHPEYLSETLSVAHIASNGHQRVSIGPLQHDEIDVGEAAPARCVNRALWLARSEQTAFALVVAPAERFGQFEGVHVEIAVPPGDVGASLSRVFLDELETLVNRTGSYRGKVLSLEAISQYTGKAGSVKVHRLRTVTRDEVILPEKTLRLLERNVEGFVMRRSAQFNLEAGADGDLDLAHIEAAVDELLFAGGSLNLKLLGAATT